MGLLDWDALHGYEWMTTTDDLSTFIADVRVDQNVGTAIDMKFDMSILRKFTYRA